VTLHEIGDPTMSVVSVKRLLAMLGAALVVVVLGAFLLLISFAVRETGDGANPDRAFSSTELDPDALLAEIAWLPDAEDLVRGMEPGTRDQLGVTWLRADDALTRAALGETSGLDVWFVDAALNNAEARFAAESRNGVAVNTSPSIAHQLRVDFYSLDGQVVVLTVDTIRERPEGTTSTAETIEQLEAILVLSDGNWRVRHLERLTDTDLPIQIES
jgi:hypothetical protein